MMRLLETDLLGSIATSFAPALFIWSLKSAVLLIIAALVTYAWRRGSASRRHAVWCIAICATLAIPFFAGVLPGWRVVPSFDWAATRTIASSDQVAAPRSPLKPVDGIAIATVPFRSPPAFREAANEPSELLNDQRGVEHLTMTEADAVAPVASKSATTSWGRFALAIWMVGVFVCCVRMSLSWLALLRLRCHSQHVTHGPGHDLFDGLCRRMRMRQSIRLLVGTRNDVPMAWGVLQPCVYLPKSAKKWGKTRLTAVLMHELGHLRRRDPLTQWGTQLACALQWMNPVIWYAAWQMRVEREQACDDMVVVSGLDVTDYAEQLLRVVASLDPRRVACAAGLSMATPGHLEWRVHALLNHQTSRKPANALILSTIAAIGLSLAIPLAVLEAAGRDVQSATETSASPGKSQQPSGLKRLNYVDDTAEGSRSIAGSGHAVLFRRPNDVEYLRAVEIFASRYGYPQPPAEDFHVYILDKSQKLLHAFPFPYSEIERGNQRWYTLKLPAVKVPKQFYVALAFNPHQTKGVYLGMDEDAKKSHSFTGRPTTGYEPLEDRADWMVRAVLARKSASQNPFAVAGQGDSP